MTELELAPCPFCGGKAEHMGGHVRCTENSCPVTVSALTSADWNTRAHLAGAADTSDVQRRAYFAYRPRSQGCEMTQMDVVERMAEAIYAKDPVLVFHERPGGPPGNQLLDWEVAPEPVREKARDQARAAIAAYDLAVGERLKPWLRHSLDCASQRDLHNDTLCRCGLDTALRALSRRELSND